MLISTAATIARPFAAEYSGKCCSRVVPSDRWLIPAALFPSGQKRYPHTLHSFIVSLSTQMTILINELVTGDACEIAHQMLRRLQLRNAIHLSKDGLPHRLQAVFGAVENPHLATSETTSDRAADVWTIAVHQLFRSGHVPIVVPYVISYSLSEVLEERRGQAYRVSGSSIYVSTLTTLETFGNKRPQGYPRVDPVSSCQTGHLRNHYNQPRRRLWSQKS